MFAQTFASLRKKAGITQSQFASDFHCSRSTVAMWELGQRIPDLDTLSKIADYFNVSLDVFAEKSNLQSLSPSPNTRIRELRLQKGISQTKLSEILGIAQNTLSYWEQGKYDIDLEHLCALADYFDCTVDYILNRSEHAGNSSPLREPFEGDVDFSERLKTLRKSKKVTQEQLAAIIGVERSSVGKYESANVIPSPDVLGRMSEYFGVSIDFLLRNPATSATPPAPPAITDRDIQVALFGGDEEVTDEMWEEVKSFAEFVKSKNKGK